MVKMKRFLLILSLPILLALFMACLIGVFLLTLPSVKDLSKCIVTTMNKVELCASKDTYTPLPYISPLIVDAIVASEDAMFFSHQGFDWYEIKESFKANLKAGKMVRGGSTITQQLVKNVFLDGEKNLLRKVREALLTRSVEEQYTKEEILEKYLNVVEFGPKIFGVRQATRYYFDKTPAQVNALEAAYLAFLLPNPRLHHVYFKKSRLTPYAQQRILGICLSLYRFKKISRQDLEIANFNVLEFPWKGLLWERNDIMNTVNEMLQDETGEEDSTLPLIQDDLPEIDPDLVGEEDDEGFLSGEKAENSAREAETFEGSSINKGESEIKSTEEDEERFGEDEYGEQLTEDP